MLLTLPLVLFIVMTEVSIGSVTVLVLLDWRNEVKRGFLVSYALIYLGLAYLTYLFQQNFSTPQLLNLYPQLDQHWVPYQSLPLLLFFLLMIPYNLFLWFDRNAGVDSGKQAKKQLQSPTSTPNHVVHEEQVATTPHIAQATGETATNEETPKATPEAVATVELASAVSATSENKATSVSEQRPTRRISTIRVLRLLSGVLTVVAGLATLLVMAMIYRPLGGAGLGGVLTVASFFAASLALGGVLTAMWLGHWYLVTPALSEKPLQFATTLVLLGVLAQVVFALSAIAIPAHSSTTAQRPIATPVVTTPSPTQVPTSKNPQVKPPSSVPTVTPLSTDAITWVRVLVSFVIPLVLGGLAWKLIRDRSFQSATGMLYLVVVCTLAGEAMARGLFLGGL